MPIANVHLATLKLCSSSCMLLNINLMMPDFLCFSCFKFSKPCYRSLWFVVTIFSIKLFGNSWEKRGCCRSSLLRFSSFTSRSLICVALASASSRFALPSAVCSVFAAKGMAVSPRVVSCVGFQVLQI